MAGDVTIGCLSRPYGNLGPAEAYERIAAAGFTELGVYPNPYPGELPLRDDDDRVGDLGGETSVQSQHEDAG